MLCSSKRSCSGTALALLSSQVIPSALLQRNHGPHSSLSSATSPASPPPPKLPSQPCLLSPSPTFNPGPPLMPPDVRGAAGPTLPSQKHTCFANQPRCTGHTLFWDGFYCVTQPLLQPGSLQPEQPWRADVSQACQDTQQGSAIPGQIIRHSAG